MAALWQRWLLGTHPGAVRPQHLDYYLDEFTFRFKRRRSASRGIQCAWHRTALVESFIRSYRAVSNLFL